MTADWKNHLCAFHIFANFSPKWANIYISSVLLWTGASFHHLKRLSESRKKDSFSCPRTCEEMSFWAFHSFAYFSSKWAKIYISSVLWSSGGDFYHFKWLFRKSKNLKFVMSADLQKMSFLGISHISHPNEQMFTFQVSCGQLGMVFVILKGFSDSQRNLSFSWHQPCETMSFWGMLTCLFLF